MAILSTCNRVEIYATSPSVVFDELEAFLEETRGVPRWVYSSHLYRLADEDAVAHLFDVAAGLQAEADAVAVRCRGCGQEWTITR